MAKKTTKKTNGKNAKTTKQATATNRQSGLDLAAKVLVESKKPMNAGMITARVIAAGWKTDGKTPSQTLHAAMGREIKALGAKARFKKTGRGLFAANR